MKTTLQLDPHQLAGHGGKRKGRKQGNPFLAMFERVRNRPANFAAAGAKGQKTPHALNGKTRALLPQWGHAKTNTSESPARHILKSKGQAELPGLTQKLRSGEQQNWLRRFAESLAGPGVERSLKAKGDQTKLATAVGPLAAAKGDAAERTSRPNQKLALSAEEARLLEDEISQRAAETEHKQKGEAKKAAQAETDPKVLIQKEALIEHATEDKAKNTAVGAKRQIAETHAKHDTGLSSNETPLGQAGKNEQASSAAAVKKQPPQKAAVPGDELAVLRQQAAKQNKAGDSLTPSTQVNSKFAAVLQARQQAEATEAQVVAGRARVGVANGSANAKADGLETFGSQKTKPLEVKPGLAAAQATKPAKPFKPPSIADIARNLSGGNQAKKTGVSHIDNRPQNILTANAGQATKKDPAGASGVNVGALKDVIKPGGATRRVIGELDTRTGTKAGDGKISLANANKASRPAAAHAQAPLQPNNAFSPGKQTGDPGLARQQAQLGLAKVKHLGNEATAAQTRVTNVSYQLETRGRTPSATAKTGPMLGKTVAQAADNAAASSRVDIAARQTAQAPIQNQTPPLSTTSSTTQNKTTHLEDVKAIRDRKAKLTKASQLAHSKKEQAQQANAQAAANRQQPPPQVERAPASEQLNGAFTQHRSNNGQQDGGNDTAFKHNQGDKQAKPQELGQAGPKPTAKGAVAESFALNAGQGGVGDLPFGMEYDENGLPQPLFRRLFKGMKQAAVVAPRQVQLKLSPSQLGGLKVRVLKEGDQFSVKVTADKAETAELLKEHLPEFEQKLKDEGVELGEFDVHEEGEGRESASQQRQQQDRREMLALEQELNKMHAEEGEDGALQVDLSQVVAEAALDESVNETPALEDGHPFNFTI